MTLRVAGTVLIIVAITYLITALITVNALTAGFAYLITILLVAASWGLYESVAASIAATLCLNYFFLPPIGMLTIADPQNWVSLFAFLITSLVASQLSDRAQQRAAEATNRQVEMERLYALSRATMLMDHRQPVGMQIAIEVARIYDFPSVVIYDRNKDEIHRAGPEDIPDIERRLRETALTGSQTRVEDDKLLLTAISLGGHAIGSFAARGGTVSDAGLNALLNLIALSLENARSREVATRADAARQSEEFKSTLLDGVAHEFKTPLTSIKAATSGLLSSSISDPEQQRELLTVIDQEADRLSGLVTEAIHLARIEAGKLHLIRTPCSVQGIIDATLKPMEFTFEGRTLEIHIEPGLPQVAVDSDLMQLALRQLLDNAVKYSPQQTPIRVNAGLSGEMIAIRVHNAGEALSETEQAKIFEKFYRGSGARNQVAGTGMGLAIAREILRAHGGDIHIESGPDKGIDVTAIMPATRKGGN